MQIGLFGLLFLVFLVLKLTEVIAWSWWWVTAPLWGGVLLWIVIMLAIFYFAMKDSKGNKLKW